MRPLVPKMIFLPRTHFLYECKNKAGIEAGFYMKKSTFAALQKSMEEGLKIAQGDIPKQTRIAEYTIREPKDYNAKDIKVIRYLLGISQPVFAGLLAVTVSALRNWEQGRNKPSAMARRFLELIKEDPESFIHQTEEMEIIEHHQRRA